MPAVLYDVASHVARITLHRPEKYNAFNTDLAKELLQCLREAVADPVVRCIYLTGTGKAFSTGQDISALESLDAATIHRLLTECYNPLITTIRSAPKPVVCGVNGIAAGAGANIALSADVVVAAESAVFIQAFSRIGLVPDSGGTYFLPRLVGFQKALALAITGDKVTAAEAERWGMIYKVFADAVFNEETTHLCEQLAAMPTRAIHLIKRAFNQTFQHTLTQQLGVEDEMQQQAAGTSDFMEGVNAFREKRKAVFRGE